MPIDLSACTTRTRAEIKDQENIPTTKSSAKHAQLYNLQKIFIEELKQDPAQIKVIQNTFLVAIKFCQEAVEHGGRSYFNDLNHYGEINQDLLSKLLTTAKQQLETIVVHRWGFGNTKINFSKLFDCNNTNYSRHAIHLRDFIKAYEFKSINNLDGQPSYTGTMVNGQKEGQGTRSYSDGSSYTGAWAHGKKEGFGTYTYPDGVRYAGTWVGGQKDGPGTLTYLDGASYAGTWVKGKKEGLGTYTFPDGSSYAGLVKQGMTDEIQEHIARILITDPENMPYNKFISFYQNTFPWNNEFKPLQTITKTQIFYKVLGPYLKRMQTVTGMQNFYKAISPYLIQLSSVTKDEIISLETHAAIAQESMVLILDNTKNPNNPRIEVLTVAYIIKSMVTNLITQINCPQHAVEFQNSQLDINRILKGKPLESKANPAKNIIAAAIASHNVVAR